MTHVAATTPYPWPWDGALDPARTAVVVTGWDAHWGATTVRDGVDERIEALAGLGAPVVVVAHRAAAPLDDRLGPALRAFGVDGFHESGLDTVLRDAGADQLLLCGLGLETTVHSTMRSANDRGLECLLVVDACAPVDPALTPNAVSMVEMSGGIFGAVGRTADVLAAYGTVPTPERIRT